ncbi:MAG TPA: S9 family peptidase [Bryobacteraceae bacterium]|nr:S9 family peptidase [Bryobacteraceae bacterium]
MRRALLLLAASAAAVLAQKQAFDVDALMKLVRIGESQISPDGRTVAFSAQFMDVAGNQRPRQIYTVPTAGGTPIRITHEGDNNERPRWSPDSKHIAFVSGRGGSAQVWMMDADGANPRQLTSLATEASGVLFSPDGKHLLFTSDVYPGCGADNACNQKKLDEDKNSKVKARIYTGLLYRHWTRWQSARRSHLFVVPVGGGAPKDLTPGDRDVPPFSLGGADDYAVSPDGTEVCFAMNSDPVPAISTNSDLYVVSIEGGDARRVTTNPGADNGPLYSPDGKFIAWLSQARAGYESDRWRLLVLERSTGRLIHLTENIDRWVTGFTWSPDSTTLFFTAEDRGRQAIQFVSVSGGQIRMAASGESHLSDMQFTPDGKIMIYTGQSGSQPAEIFRASSAGGAAVPLTHLNDVVLNSRELIPLEEFWVEGAEGARVHAFMLKPYGFRKDRKYPVLLLIHGGPQGAWGQQWTYRWNAQVFAAAGYVVVMPNPRGSTGYGQKFIDEINRDWGGRAFDDVMAVTDHLATLPYVDPSRMAAAGGSYGGYMVNWILGHTARFKALVSHAGVYELKSMFGETEELWFPLWEFGGSPWENPENYTRWSPAEFVKEFRTPTLVIHGELDYRVPYGQGLQLFTALQLQKVPSKLLLYPDEGHWIQKPQNAALWYKTFIDWIDTWTKKSE